MVGKESDELYWRETYFIVFPGRLRPTVEQVERVLGEASSRMQVENLAGDDQGSFQSVLVESPEDHAAVEVSFEEGDIVIEQNLAWVKELKKTLTSDQLQRLMAADARLDVAHFERRRGGASPAAVEAEPHRSSGTLDFDEMFSDDAYADDEELNDPELGMLDPTCLLTVVQALAGLTEGMTVDPASGEIV